MTVKWIKGQWHLLNAKGTSLGVYVTFGEAYDAKRYILLAPHPFTLSRR